MIHWTDEARSDLEGIVAWLHERNPYAAAKVGEDVLASVQRLTAFPLSGRKGRRDGTRELIVSRRPFIVVYRVVDGHAVILRVLHGAMQWPPSDEAA